MLSPTSRILDPAAPAPCSRVVAISEAILKEKDLGALAIFLNSIQLEEESDVIEDLRQWLPVLDNFDGLLAVLCQQIVTTGTSTEETILQTQFENSEYDVKLVLCSILYFLRGLMKRGKEKRCFLSYKYLGILINAIDTEIVELAMDVLFCACTPGFSIVTYAPQEIDLKETIEVPTFIALDVLAIFEGLGILSANYGILEYLRGHEPPGVGPNHKQLSLHFPAQNRMPSFPDVAPISANSISSQEESKAETIEQPLENLHNILENNRNSKMDIQVLKSLADSSDPTIKAKRGLSLLSVLRGMAGLKGDPMARYRMVFLRLQCLYILIHSKLPSDRLSPYLCNWSIVFKDCVAIADYASELMAELHLVNPTALSTVALECTVALLECSVRRRGPLIDRQSILQELGITRQGSSGLTNSQQEPLWSSIVLSACSLSSYLFDERTEATSALRLSSPHSYQMIFDNAKTLRKAMNWGLYIRLGLELFVIGLSAREQNPTAAYSSFDAGMVSAIVGVIQSSLPALTAILTDAERARVKSGNPAVAELLPGWDEAAMWTLGKVLVAIRRSFDVPQYHNAVRDNDGLAPVIGIIEIFVNTRINTGSVNGIDLIIDSSSSNLLDTALEIIAISLDSNRRAAPGSNASAVQIIHQPCFQKICNLIFSLPFKGNEDLWCELVHLLKGAINAEPSFLGQVLRSEYIQAFVKALDVKATEQTNPRSLVLSSKRIDDILCLLSKLLISICITPEGQAFLVANKLPEFIIEIFYHKSVLLPACEGLQAETCHRVAKALSNIIRDCPSAVEDMKVAMQHGLRVTSNECRDAWATIEQCDDAENIASARMQALQKLAHMCNVVESVCSSDQRRNSASAEMMREVMNEDIVTHLIYAYQSTLPPPRQLLAQLGVRHIGAHAYCGYYPTANKLSSLLKAASTMLPHIILPVLFKCIDETLSAVSAAKSSLRAVAVAHAASPDLSVDVLCKVVAGALEGAGHAENQEGLVDRSARRQQRRSRGNSLSGEGANVLVLGALDFIPQTCLHECADDAKNKELQLHAWKFIVPILILEWHSSILSYCLRPIQRSPHTVTPILVNGKDVIRRLFAFHRSSMLEVCRFASTKWAPKPISETATRKSFLHSVADCDSSEDFAPVSRIPTTYQLRVVSSSGALIREDCEIEGSRVVLLATFGSVCTAYERSLTAAGVVRYRTEYGWLSEYRRDHREPIMEILDMTNAEQPLSQHEAFKAVLNKPPSALRPVESLTIRESASYAMKRVHVALRQASLFLSRAMLVENTAESRIQNRNGRPVTLSSSAPVLVNSLKKILKGFFVQPMECLEAGALPSSYTLSINTARESIVSASTSSRDSSAGQLTPPIREWGVLTPIGMEESMPPSKDKQSQQRPKSAKKEKNERRSLSRSNSKDFSAESEPSASNEESKESVSINAAAMCLYVGSVIKCVVMPSLDDRYGNINTYLIRSLSGNGCIDALMDAFTFIVGTLSDAISLAPTSNDESPIVLSSAGHCALQALPSVLALLRKLVQKDCLAKCSSGADPTNRGPNPISAAIANLSDDQGVFQLHELVYNILHTISARCLPLFRSKQMTLFPAYIQTEWYQFVGELLQSLRAPLPLPSDQSSAEVPAYFNPFRPPSSLDRERERDRLWHFGSNGARSGLGAAFDRINQVLMDSAPASSGASAINGFASPPAITGAGPAPVGAGASGNTEPVSGGPGTASTPPIANPPNQPSPASQGTTSTAEMLVSAFGNISSINLEEGFSSPIPLADNQNQFLLDQDLLNEAGGDPDLLLALQLSMGQIIPPTQPNLLTEPLESPASQPSSEVLSGASDVVVTPPVDTQDAGSPEDTAESLQLSGVHAPLSRLVPTSAQTQQQNRTRGVRSASRIARVSNLLRDEPLSPAIVNAPSGMPPLPPSRETANTSSSAQRRKSGEEKKSPQSGSSKQAAQNDLAVDLASKSAHLGQLAAMFNENVVDSMVDSCALRVSPTSTSDENPIDITSAVDVQGQANTSLSSIAPQLCRFMIQLKNASDSGLLSAVSPVEMLLKRLAESIEPSAVAHPVDLKFERSQYGCMHLLLCCLRSTELRSDVEKTLTKTFTNRLIKSLVVRIESEAGIGRVGGADTPLWISPALLILFQLLCSEAPPDAAVAAAEESKDDDEEAEIQQLLYDNDEDMRALCRSLLGEFLVSTSLWRSIFNATCKVLRTFSKAPVASKINSETVQSLLMVLTVLLAKQTLCDAFVRDGGLNEVLKLPMNLSSNEVSVPPLRSSSSVLAVIIQRCLETPIELRSGMGMSCRTFWKDHSRQSTLKPNQGIPLNSFMEFAQSAGFLKRSPIDFCSAVNSTLAFIADADASATVDVQICLLTKKVHEERARQDKLNLIKMAAESSDSDVDSRALRTLRVVLEHIRNVVSLPSIGAASPNWGVALAQRTENDPYLFTVSQTMHALSDSLLTIRRLPEIMNKNGLSMSNSVSLPDFLLDTVFREDEGKARRTVIPAASRLLVALCAYKGACRKSVLNALIHSLTSRVSQEVVGTTKEAQIVHMRHLARLARLVALVSAASRTNSIPESARQSGQAISADTIKHLISADIQFLLTRALASVPLDSDMAADVIDAIFEPLEMITRPKLFEHLQCVAALPSDGNASNAVASNSFAVSGQARSMATSAEAGDAMPASEQEILVSSEPQGPAWSMDVSDIEHDREDQEGDDEDDDDEDDDEDEGDEDEGDEENEDIDEQDDDNGGIEVSIHLPQSDANGPGSLLGGGTFSLPFATHGSLSGNGNALSSFLQSHVRDVISNALANDHNGISFNDVMAGGGGLFVTPPDQIRRDPLNRILSISPSMDMEADSATEAIIVNILRQNAPATMPGSTHEQDLETAFSSFSSWRNNRGDLSTTNLLSSSVQQALQVQPRNCLIHPLLANNDFTVDQSLQGAVLTESSVPVEQSRAISREQLVNGQRIFAHQSSTAMQTPGADADPLGFGSFFQRPTTASTRSHRNMLEFATSFGLTRRDAEDSLLELSIGPGTAIPADRHVPLGIFAEAPHALGLRPNAPIRSTTVVRRGLNRNETEETARDGIVDRASADAAQRVSAHRNPLFDSLRAAITSRQLPSYDSTVMEALPHAPLPLGPAIFVEAPEIIYGTVPEPQNEPVATQEPVEQAEAIADLDSIISPSIDTTPTETAGAMSAEMDAEARASPTDSSASADDFPPQSPPRSHGEQSPLPAWSLAGVQAMEEETCGSAVLGREEEAEQALELAQRALQELELEASGAASSSPSVADLAAVEQQPSSPSIVTAPEPSVASLSRPDCPAGYDPDVFYSLPDFMQQEILEQHGETNQPDNVRELAEAAGFDYETFLCLPESIRQELLDQARRDQAPPSAAANPTNAQEMDNASFLASLNDPVLRAEVLLTADPAFLATLPPELMAEAQMHRERAAAQWQRSDRSQSGRPSHRSSTASANSASAAAQSQRRLYMHESDDEEDDDDDDDADDDPDASERRARSRRSTDRSGPAPGTMLVPADDQMLSLVPRELLIVLAHILITSNFPLNNALLHRILLNISKSPELRDLTLRLCLNMMMCRQEAVDKCVALLEGGNGKVSCLPDSKGEARLSLRKAAARAAMQSTSVNSNIPRLGDRISESADSSSLPDSSQLNDNSGKSSSTMPVNIVRRLAGTVAQIVSHNESISFDLLRSRLSVAGEATSLEEFLVHSEESQEDSDSAAGNQKPRSIASGDSTNSLLEAFISLLAEDAILQDSHTLTTLTGLVSIISGPLELLVSEGDSVDSDVLRVKIKGKKKDNRLEPRYVPTVRVSPNALHALCNVLLADSCSQAVFDSIVLTVSRLAKVRYNRTIVLLALTDVAEDLAVCSQGKLNSLGDILEALDHAGSGEGRPSGLHLPIGQVSGRTHERLLRAIETLHKVSLKSSKVLVDYVPMGSTASLWSALDRVLELLRRYSGSDDENKEDAAKLQSHSALVAFLSRLTPAIEAYFLVFASEILSEGEKLTEGAPSIRPSKSTSTSALPGESYHKSVAYQSMNLPLMPQSTEGAEDGGMSKGIALQRSNSLTLSRQLSQSQSSSGPPSPGGTPTTSGRFQRALMLQAFVQSHKGVLNLLVAARPAALEGSLMALIRVPLLRNSLIFDNKRRYFFAQLKKQRASTRRMGLNLQLRRDQVFEDSFNQLRMRSAAELRGRLQISFRGEEGIDAGGLTREWYIVISREIFNPNYALFMTADGSTFQPWSQSMINSNHLDYFKFVGRVIGKAICDQQLMDAHFTRSFYKHLIGIPVDYSDIEATDPEYFKSLKQILEYSLQDLGVELTFSAEAQIFGRQEIVDLIPGGRHIAVTDENKSEYVSLVAKHRMTNSIKAQIDSFLDGFYDLVPPELITIFSPTELELLICGLPDVDIDDLRNNTDYHNFQPADQAIGYFWEALQSFSREERALFLQFVTGTSKVPLEGFASLQGMRGPQRFSIHRAFNTALLPTAHTCFNQLDLPAYTSAEELREKLLIALRNSSEGFGFA